MNSHWATILASNRLVTGQQIVAAIVEEFQDLITEDYHVATEQRWTWIENLNPEGKPLLSHCINKIDSLQHGWEEAPNPSYSGCAANSEDAPVGTRILCCNHRWTMHFTENCTASGLFLWGELNSGWDIVFPTRLPLCCVQKIPYHCAT
jgi:hypothetical protein